MSGLDSRIARLIEANGPITIAQYMALCLYDPEDGYYATREPIGAQGDFITAPEVSQMFGELIGLWCAQVWLDQHQTRSPEIVELGPGRGTLMADALRALRVAPSVLSGCHVTMIEASPHLRREQGDRLRDASVPIAWETRFRPAEEGGPLFVIANEFFDALPIRQFVKRKTGWHERLVHLDGQRLAFALAPVAADGFIPTEYRQGDENAVFERCDQAVSMVGEIARAVQARGGGAIFVDYGYSAPPLRETLQAVSEHRASSLLSHAGQSDLSAHVDFRALADAAEAAGAQAFGPKEQGEFLRGLGIEARASRLGRSPEVSAALDRLIGTAAMGSLFKALAIVPANAPPPPGFA